MKKRYIKPDTSMVKLDVETYFMVNSTGADSHEGFTSSTDGPVIIDDASDEDTPF
jgi:hypothetical protein